MIACLWPLVAQWTPAPVLRSVHMVGFFNALVVQWIELPRPKGLMSVRFRPRAPKLQRTGAGHVPQSRPKGLKCELGAFQELIVRFLPRAPQMPKPEHVSGFVRLLLVGGIEGEGRGPASTRGCPSRAERRKNVAAIFRALGLFLPRGQNFLAKDSSINETTR